MISDSESRLPGLSRTAATERFKHLTEDNKHNPLVKHLPLDAYNYMSEIVKDLP